MTAKKTPSEAIQEEALTPEQLLAEIDITDAPALRPPGTLRIAQRKKLIGLVSGLQIVDIDSDAFLDVIDEMDQALERVAVDPAAYAEWATGADAEQRVLKLFTDYSTKLGELTRSAN